MSFEDVRINCPACGCPCTTMLLVVHCPNADCRLFSSWWVEELYDFEIVKIVEWLEKERKK